MTQHLILASASIIRQNLLQNAGVSISVTPARIDETAVKAALLQEAASPRDVADTLAELKAQKVAAKHPGDLVLGCDQVLAFDRQIIDKPTSQDHLMAQLQVMRGKPHQLLSAAVLYQNGEPLWRHVGVVRMYMRNASDAYLEDYVTRNWVEVQHCVGGYMLEAEGARLFDRIEGDYFTVLGLPLLPLLSYLTLRGTLDG